MDFLFSNLHLNEPGYCCTYMKNSTIVFIISVFPFALPNALRGKSAEIKGIKSTEKSLRQKQGVRSTPAVQYKFCSMLDCAINVCNKCPVNQ